MNVLKKRNCETELIHLTVSNPKPKPTTKPIKPKFLSKKDIKILYYKYKSITDTCQYLLLGIFQFFLKWLDNPVLLTIKKELGSIAEFCLMEDVTAVGQDSIMADI